MTNREPGHVLKTMDTVLILLESHCAVRVGVVLENHGLGFRPGINSRTRDFVFLTCIKIRDWPNIAGRIKEEICRALSRGPIT